MVGPPGGGLATRRMAARRPARSTPWLRILLLISLVAGPWIQVQSADARSPLQDILLEEDTADLLDRPISKVTITGLKRLTDAQIRTNLRVAAGQPFDPQAVRDDVRTLYRLGQFSVITPTAGLAPDGTVVVDYLVSEQALIAAVQTVGNKVISDQELRALIPLFANAPRHDFLVEQ